MQDKKSSSSTASGTTSALLIGLFGVALLGGAIILMTRLAEQYASDRGQPAQPIAAAALKTEKQPSQTGSGQTSAPAQRIDTSSADSSGAAAVQAEETDSSKPSDENVDTAVPLTAANDESKTDGSWIIEVDDGSYKPDEAGLTTISVIAAHLRDHPADRLLLVGTNHIKKSSKRARQGAKSVEQRIVDEEPSARGRISIEENQLPDAEGLYVVGRITGGDQ